MPSATSGWNRDELIMKVLDTLGRTTDTTLKARMQEDINFAQLGFWKLFDWKFARTQGGSTTFTCYQALANQTARYSTTQTDSGGNTVAIRTSDIEKVYLGYNVSNPSSTTYQKFSRVLKRVENRDQILADPGFEDTGIPEYYYPVGNDKIEIWPPPDTSKNTPVDLVDATNGTYLWIAGKRMPNFMDDSTDYPDIPIEYQETFYHYLLWRTLSRERDPRQTDELAILNAMVANDKRTDLSEPDNNLRMKWPEEELNDRASNLRYQDVLWRMDD